MTRRRAGAACLSGALLTVFLTAAPALAASNDELGPREGADLSSGLSVAGTVLLFVVVPALLVFGIAALVWLPGMRKAHRYRPQQGWSAAPVWFAGPPDPVAAVETADPQGAGRGGASGSW